MHASLLAKARRVLRFRMSLTAASMRAARSACKEPGGVPFLRAALLEQSGAMRCYKMANGDTSLGQPILHFLHLTSSRALFHYCEY